MQTRMFSILVLSVVFALSLTSAAEAQHKPPGGESVPPLPPMLFVPSDHIPCDPYQRFESLPRSPYTQCCISVRMRQSKLSVEG